MPAYVLIRETRKERRAPLRVCFAAVAGLGLGAAMLGGTAYGPALAAVRISYPRVTAQAGPCGLWPRDIGPTFNRDYFENQPYWNLGCAMQRNVAAMVEEPGDLVQPRGESPAYTGRRTVVLDKYRRGDDPTTLYRDADKAKITDVAK